MTYQHTSQIETQTDANALKSVLAWFDQFQSAPIPHNIWLQCQLALIEGFTNAVRHAHAGLPPETPIGIEASVSDRAIDIRIRDHGPGFDLTSVLRHKITVNDPDSEGGRGLKIMYLIADRLTYEPADDRGNCLHLHKAFDL
ncbi:MAG: anti-sigma regulatory factor [Shackletoniella antarctica]|uniref:Anti-sigma regulatory factor n=1 Tax=Shackletoniella antarctica TaxID=268115 RepID=A0A2W4VN89_9CYAN|nr:MAG: anti-sigma regulatory factor [Shackletoniella antarctica]